MTAPPKTYHVKSFGCQMNVYDGERMAELLGAQGMTSTDAASADLVVLNTCHIREKAADRAYSDVGRLRRDDGSKPLIALAGCVAQAEGAEARRRSPMIDIVVGPQAYHRLPDMVGEAASGRVQLLIFFAANCPYCRENVGAWKRIPAELRADSAKRFDVISVSLSSSDSGRAWMREHGLSLTDTVVRMPERGQVLHMHQSVFAHEPRKTRCCA